MEDPTQTGPGAMPLLEDDLTKDRARVFTEFLDDEVRWLAGIGRNKPRLTVTAGTDSQHQLP